MVRLRRLPRAFRPPLVLLAAAIVIGLCVAFVPDPPSRVAVMPLPAWGGGPGAVEFHAVLDEYYGLEVEMDQATAKRLYPCTADPDRFTDPTCQKQTMPVALSFRLLADGKEVQRGTFSAEGVHGGRYGADETFGLDFERTKLKRGHLYRLEARALTDGAALAPARPRLVVEADSIDRMNLMLYRALAGMGAFVLLLIAGLWAGLVVVRSFAAKKP